MKSYKKFNNFSYYYNFSLFDGNTQLDNYGASVVYNYNENFSKFLPILDTLVVNNPLEINNYYYFSSDENLKYYFLDNFQKITPQPFRVFVPLETLTKNNFFPSLSKIPQHVKITIPKIPNLDSVKDSLQSLKALFFANDIRFINGTTISVEKYLLLAYLWSSMYSTQKEYPEKDFSKLKQPEPSFFQSSILDLMAKKDLMFFGRDTKGRILSVDHFQKLLQQMIDNLDDGSRAKRTADIAFNKKNNTKIYPLYYIIKKFYSRSNTPFQEIYIPFDYENSINYIDTQVLPNQNYTYKIDLLSICTSIRTNGDPAYNIDHPIKGENYWPNTKSKKLEPTFTQSTLEVNLFQKTPQVNSYFPLIPDVSFFSLIENPNFIQIFLNSKVAYEKVKQFDILDSNQASDKEVYFNNSNYNSFIIYKIVGKKPSSYKDFESSRYKVIKLPDNTFLEEVEYNKDYYYLFTTFDGKNYSNPSEIIHVNIQKINDAIVPILETYIPDLEVIEKELITSKQFKQRISLNPSIFQLDLERSNTDEKTYENDDQKLQFDTKKYLNLPTVYGDKISNKSAKFKVRVISKTSGKIVDINLNFKHRVINKAKIDSSKP